MTFGEPSMLPSPDLGPRKIVNKAASEVRLLIRFHHNRNHQAERAGKRFTHTFSRLISFIEPPD